MKIGVASDHVGFELKPSIIEYISSLGYEVIDYGPSNNTRTDYPLYAEKVAEEIIMGNIDKGILICGTGVGISIAANKFKGIRAVVCSEPYSAKLSKEHNDTNILAFGSRVIGIELAKMITFEWLNAVYEGGRHANRVKMIGDIENK